MKLSVCKMGLLILLSCACSNKRVAINHSVNKVEVPAEQKESKPIRLAHAAFLEVEGIECQYCADTVINELEKIEGIDTAKYEMVSPDFEENRIKVVYQNQDLATLKQQVYQVLNQEGFEIKSFESA